MKESTPKTREDHQRAWLGELSKLLTAQLPGGVGFLLFLVLAGEVHYVASAGREDAFRMLRDYLARTDGADPASVARAIVDAESQSPRGIALSEIARGLVIEMTGDPGDEGALFLFTCEPGEFAWYVTDPGVRGAIKHWLHVRGGTTTSS